MNQIFLNSSTPDVGKLVTVWCQPEDVCIAHWGHMLLLVDSVSTVMILNTGDYTPKVALSAVTKCWHMYPTFLWRTGLHLTWSLLTEAVIQQCDLMFQCLPVSEIYKNGILHYIPCQHIPSTSCTLHRYLTGLLEPWLSSCRRFICTPDTWGNIQRHFQIWHHLAVHP